MMAATHPTSAELRARLEDARRQLADAESQWAQLTLDASDHRKKDGLSARIDLLRSTVAELPRQIDIAEQREVAIVSLRAKHRDAHARAERLLRDAVVAIEALSRENLVALLSAAAEAGQIGSILTRDAEGVRPDVPHPLNARMVLHRAVAQLDVRLRTIPPEAIVINRALFDSELDVLNGKTRRTQTEAPPDVTGKDKSNGTTTDSQIETQCR